MLYLQDTKDLIVKMRADRNQYQTLVMILALVFSSACMLLLLSSPNARADSHTNQRLVVAGGALTEIIYALGAEQQIVGVDTTSLWPAQARTLPQVGYQRALSAEGVLSLQPDLLLGTDDTGPATVLAHLREAGLMIQQVEVPDTTQGLVAKVETVAQLVHRQAQAVTLIANIEQQMADLAQQYGERANKPKVAFLLGGGHGSPMTSGFGTSADAAIGLAGGINAFNSYPGYKPLNSEAMIAAAPEVILLTERTLKAIGGVDGLLAMPGIAQTPAGQAQRIIALDGLALLGFGPRTPATLMQLAQQLYPQ